MKKKKKKKKRKFEGVFELCVFFLFLQIFLDVPVKLEVSVSLVSSWSCGGCVVFQSHRAHGAWDQP